MKSFLALLLAAATLSAQEPIRGFPQTQWAAERELEQKANAVPQASRQKIYLERMAKVPHHAGSPATTGSFNVARNFTGLTISNVRAVG